MLKVKGSKRSGLQECDCCCRDFDVALQSYKGREAAFAVLVWICPHCGYDNKPEMTERIQLLARKRKLC